MDLRTELTELRSLVNDRIDRAIASLPPDGPRLIDVSTAAELTAALETGGQIGIYPGTYLGNFVVSTPCTLEGLADDVWLEPADALTPALRVLANDVTVRRLNVMGGAPDRETIVVGDFEATRVEDQPHTVLLENVVAQASGAGGHRGFALHGVNITLRNCAAFRYFEKGRDSQAVWIHNGPGPYLIEDCVLEASGENVLLGGAGVAIPGCIPSDVVIRRNVLRKPLSIKGQGWQVKCSFEVKNGQRVRFEDNLIDGWWPDQHQAPIQITPRNQDGQSAWCTAEDVVIHSTRFANTLSGGFAINVQGTDDEQVSAQIQRLTVTGNQFAGATAFLQLLGGIAGSLTIDGNQAPDVTKRIFSFDRIRNRSRLVTPLTFTNNVMPAGQYGVTGDGSTGIGLPSLLAFCTLTAWRGNQIANPNRVPLPADV